MAGEVIEGSGHFSRSVRGEVEAAISGACEVDGKEILPGQVEQVELTL